MDIENHPRFMSRSRNNRTICYRRSSPISPDGMRRKRGPPRAERPNEVKSLFCLLAARDVSAQRGLAQQPLTLVQTIEMPEVPAGPYADHMAWISRGTALRHPASQQGCRCARSQGREGAAHDNRIRKSARGTLPGRSESSLRYRRRRRRSEIFDAATYQEIGSVKLRVRRRWNRLRRAAPATFT